MKIDPASPIGRLIFAPMRPGELAWIGLRPARRAAMAVVGEVEAIAEKGLAGDRYDSKRNGPRQVTLVAAEDLAAAGAFVGAEVGPEQLRRNLVTRGVNLIVLKDRRFRVGGVLLEGSGTCEPCSLMETTLGPGGFNALRGRGGITARVIEGGWMRLGDAVTAA